MLLVYVAPFLVINSIPGTFISSTELFLLCASTASTPHHLARLLYFYFYQNSRMCYNYLHDTGEDEKKREAPRQRKMHKRYKI